MFEKELDFFIANQDELVARYPGQVLVIKDQEVVGAFRSPLEAYLEATKRFTPGSFAIQRCLAGQDAYTVTVSGPEAGLVPA